MTKWISVENNLPDYYEYVLVYAKRKGTGEPCPISIARLEPDDNIDIWSFIADFDNGNGIGASHDFLWDCSSEDITHWMPLPKLPRQGK
jgi:hypothetical protein